MRRLAVTLTVVVILAGGALSAFHLLLSANFLASQIAEGMERSTGRKVTLGSHGSLHLWPEFGVSFNAVKLSNPPGINDGVFAEVETMRVNIGVGALFGRRAEIAEIKLINPTVNLTIDAQGRGNWETGDKARGTQLPSAALQPIYIEGGTVTFRDQRSGEAHVFKRLDLVLTLIEGSIDVKGSGDWRQDRVSFSLFLKSPQLFAGEGTPIDLNVSGSWLNFAFSGRAAAGKSFQLAGTVEGGTRSLRGLMRWAGVKIGDGRGLGVLQAQGALSLTGRSLSISKAQFRVDGMRAQGDVAVTFTDDKPKLTARLGLDALDLNQYAAAPHRMRDEAEGIEGWSSASIDFSSLSTLNVSASLRAARLIYGRALMADAAIEATVADGILNAKLDRINLYGGRVQGQVVLNGKQKVPTLQASFHGSGLDGYRLLRNIGSFTWLEGRCDFALALAATGRSQREMIASLRGTAGFALDDGTVRDVNLAKIAEVVAKNVQTGWLLEANEKTEFRKLTVNFAIADGIAESKELSIDGPQIRLRGTGLVDLLKRELDLKFVSDPVTATGANVAELAVPVVVKGPWGKPKFYPDIAGVLENPKAAYETLNTLIQRAKLAGEGAPAAREAEELLSNGNESGAEGHVDLLKKQINSDGGMDLMNGFAGESAPEIAPSEQ